MVTTFTPQKNFLGIAPETTVGTPVAPTFTIPITKPDFSDKVTWLDDPSIDGSMARLRGRQAGVQASEFAFEGPAYVDTFVHLLVSILGDRTTTGSSDPYTHAVSLLNTNGGQPKTHTLTFYNQLTAATQARTYSSACLSDLSISYDAEAKLVEFKAKGMGWPSAAAAASPTASSSTVPPFASWRAKVGIGGPASGGTLNATVATASFDLKRKLDAIYTLANTQTPYVIQRGLLDFTGKMSFIAVDESPLTTMLANTQQQIQLVIGNSIVGAGQQQITFNVNLASYKTVKANEGKEAVMWDVTLDGISNTSDAGTSGGKSPCKITVINGQAGTAY